MSKYLFVLLIFFSALILFLLPVKNQEIFAQGKIYCVSITSLTCGNGTTSCETGYKPPSASACQDYANLHGTCPPSIDCIPSGNSSSPTSPATPPASCGYANQACCPTNPKCQGVLVCKNNICEVPAVPLPPPSTPTPSSSPTCNTSVTLDKFIPCGDTKEYDYSYSTRCGPNNKGYDCTVSGAQLCINGERKEENVICQKAKPAPPPGAAGKTCDPGPGVGEPGTGIDTAIGCIPTEPTQLIMAISRLATGAGGGIALLLIIAGAFKMITSAGNPDHVKEGSDQITSAIIGLLFIIFAVLLLQIIGVNILNLPGFEN